MIFNKFNIKNKQGKINLFNYLASYEKSIAESATRIEYNMG